MMTIATQARIDYSQISGIFDSRDNFMALVNTLNSLGYGEENISVLMSETSHDNYFAARENTKAPEGATVGGIAGGAIGAIIGSLTLVGNVFAPGVGLLVSGPLVGLIAGGAIGTAAGSLVGALTGAGIPEHEATFFEEALKVKGKVILVANIPKDHVPEVKAMFERCKADKIKIYHP